ncbi:FAD-dependent monooxygenase [Kribbella sp. NPDC051587]|uniref:FAD-dependent monooxygenase n=1 Tax=Kribbella sp. NPDC051587 TaxID=3364119 RepID=UPI0037A84752
MTETVLVVGAGPTGLALAVCLAMRGVGVRVIDGAQGPSSTSRALGLQPRGAEVLERIGALGELPQRSKAMLTINYLDGQRLRLQLPVGRAAVGLEKQALLVSQAEVEGELRRRFAELGGKVEWSTRLVGCEQTTELVSATVQLADGTTERLDADWLVGCDGAHSVVRKLAGIGFPGRKLVERLLMVDVEADWPYDANGSTTWMSAGSMLSVTAMPDNVWRVFSEPPPGLPEVLSEAEITSRVLEEFSRRSGTSLDTVGSVRWASEFRLHRRLADTYRRGRIFLAGDAAHIQSPSGGQGQNTGLGDAENLGWKLALVANGRADACLLDTYEAERRPLTKRVLAATSSAIDIMLPTTCWGRFLRDHVVMPILRLRVVQRRLWLAASQLTVSYRGGPLAASSTPWSRRPRPGDRVPDLPCRRIDGTETTLHAAIGGSWVVLAKDPTPYVDALGPDLVRGFTPVGTTQPDVLLIRPDGHLAWRGRGGPEMLSTWLNQVLWPA